MRRVCTAAAIACLLLPGCGDSRAEREAAQASVDAAARAAAEAEAAKWKPKKDPDQKPTRKDFSDIDDAWTVLMEAVGKKDNDQYSAALAWLASKGQPVVERMTAIMNDTTAGATQRLGGCIVLGKVGAAARPQIIQAALSSDLGEVRKRAAEELGQMKPPTRETVDTLVIMLDKEEDELVLRHAIRALGKIGEPAKAAAAKLAAMLENPDRYDRLTLVDVNSAIKEINPRVGFHDMELEE
jgi:HEAT repeat protein